MAIKNNLNATTLQVKKHNWNYYILSKMLITNRKTFENTYSAFYRTSSDIMSSAEFCPVGFEVAFVRD